MKFIILGFDMEDSALAASRERLVLGFTDQVIQTDRIIHLQPVCDGGGSDSSMHYGKNVVWDRQVTIGHPDHG